MRVLITTLLLLTLSASLHADTRKRWAIAEFGEPMYDDSLTHWPYANPNAKRGGKIVLGAFGTFDTINPYLLKGKVSYTIGATMDALMTSSGDDLLSVYGLIASSVEYPEDISWAIFEIRPEAHYDDGEPIVADDFKLTFDTIQNHGRPFLRAFYRDVDGLEVLSSHRLKFTFKTRHNMKALMNVATLSPMPAHYWRDHDITKTTLTAWPASGAYRLKSVEPGRNLVYERVSNYWGADLPVNRGLYNFDEIRHDYYRDFGVMFEAFKAGEIDFRQESSSKRWASEYDFPAMVSGDVVRDTPPDSKPQGMQGLLLNTRRENFSDVRVREAIGLLFDFEWMQKALLYNQYTRTKSYFPNSDYGSKGMPTPRELAVLEPHRAELSAKVFDEAFEPSFTDGSGRIRTQLRKALRLFKVAGWSPRGGKLVNSKGEQMSIELLLVQPDFERLMSPYLRNLEKAGIATSMRIVDTAQYENRTDNFDFDLVNVRFNFFPPPGPELRSFYGSKSVDVVGSANMAGIRSAAVDAIIEQIVAAKDLDTLKVATRALDRILLHGHYMIPEWHNNIFRIAHWDRFGQPERQPKYGIGFPSSWWIDSEKDAQRTQLKR